MTLWLPLVVAWCWSLSANAVAASTDRTASRSGSATDRSTQDGDAEATGLAAATADPAALDPKMLRAVVDPRYGLKTLGVRPEEREAYYYVLHKASTVDPKLLRQAARRFQDRRRARFPDRRVREDPNVPFPVFVDLYRCSNQPHVYLGKPVTVEGHVRLLRQMTAGRNRYGIRTLYEAWLYTPDSQSNPICVVCTELPGGMLEAFARSPSHVLDGVSATGYFFKYMVYRAQDAYRFAPLILAGRLQWQGQRREGGGVEPVWTVWEVVLAAAAGAALLTGLLVWSERRRRAKRRALGSPPVDGSADDPQADGTSGERA